MTLQDRIRSTLGTALLGLPDPLLVNFFAGVVGFTAADVPSPIRPRDSTADVRLLIAPANYAAQAHAWARAIEAAAPVSAQNLTIGPGDSPRFATDDFVPRNVAEKSHGWGRRQTEALREAFTHVLVEAQRPILGRRLRGDVRREHAHLRSAGIAVAYVSHGSDLRRPSLHADADRWSPFRDHDWDLLSTLERVALDSRAVLDDVGEQVFVVTPDLLRDRPDATWLPNTVHPAQWATDAPLLATPQVRLLHAPTNARIKGTHLIEPVIEALVAGGGYEYRRVEGAPASAMRDAYAGADIVLEQFRLGIYSTTAIEALAAGRLVIAHVAEDVREHVLRHTGLEVPIIQATPDILADVLADIRARRDHYRAIAGRGPMFVDAVHSGRMAATTLHSFLPYPAID